MLASAARALVRQMKSAVRVSVLALAAFTVLEETALARSYLSCLAKKVVIVIDNLPKRPKMPSSRKNSSTWQTSAKRSPTTSRIVLQAGKWHEPISHSARRARVSTCIRRSQWRSARRQRKHCTGALTGEAHSRRTLATTHAPIVAGGHCVI